MNQYGVREVQKLLGLPRSTIRALIDAGFVSPARGPRNAWRFSFQDLIVLRTAQALVAAKVPPKRITRSVKALRRRLPHTMPLSGLSICAVADHVVVKEGSRRWQAKDGQYLLAFEGDPAHGSLTVLTRPQAKPACTGEELFERALALEEADAQAAVDAYRQAIASEPRLLDAYVNLGLLLHQLGRLGDAEEAYRTGLACCGEDALLLFNLGVLLQDLDRGEDAREAYEAALRQDEALADCHYNLALLYEELERPREALRHLARYHRLVKGGR